jgi:hypothetical protein
MPMPLAMNKPFVLSFLLGAVLSLAAGGCASPMPAKPDIDPLAREQVNRMQSAVERFGAYRMTIETLSDEELPSGQLVQAGSSGTLQVARPDRLSIAVERDSGDKWSGWLIGDKLVLLDETKGLYARLDLPTPLDKALDELGDRYGLELPLVDIVSNLRRASLLDRVQSGLYVGTEPVAGKECHHLLFRQPVADWQIWIEKEDPALPRKLLLVYKDLPNHPAYQTIIEKWDVSPDFKDSDWKPKLPENAREVGIGELLGQEESP